MKIGVCGISGRMGRAVYRNLLERGHLLGAAFEAESSPCIGTEAGALIGQPGLSVTVGPIGEGGLGAVEGIIDFSSPEATLKLLPVARKMKKALVIGTTGFTPEGRGRIEEASREVPVLFSPNMSVGVNLLFKLTEMASRVLEKGYDVEIFEAHHRFKKDAPSGTAKRLIEAVKSSAPALRGATEITGRDGITGERGDDEIGVMVLRGGDIVGEHTVYFVGMGERIELTHRASSRDTLAIGAVRGMEFLAGKKPGLYTMFDVLGL